MKDNLSQETVEKCSDILEKIRREHPLVHNITNYVVMNFTANALLALGASPVMAHAVEEVEEMVGLASALVINIGTLSQPWIDSMVKAARAARDRSIPIVLDPVGAGATRFRTEAARRLIGEAPVAVLRGNASEILAVAGQKGITRGVDSVHGTEDARLAACHLAKTYGTVVAVTGAEDFVTDSLRMARISNGHPLMGRVTGTGCAASAITGAFCAAETDAFAAAIGALVTFGIAGELAAIGNPGPGSFQVGLLDALGAIDGAIIRERARVAVT
ncbi:MAG TPA: hydroxyethylthiazole kinase [Deltaproteobacteria bacterium]|jgi:hydroxyethylthiazole kinase|nr:hydroxyethylthiazole kinase [Deltaproteobacteria bacterium]